MYCSFTENLQMCQKVHVHSVKLEVCTLPFQYIFIVMLYIHNSVRASHKYACISDNYSSIVPQTTCFAIAVNTSNRNFNPSFLAHTNDVK